MELVENLEQKNRLHQRTIFRGILPEIGAPLRLEFLDARGNNAGHFIEVVFGEWLQRAAHNLRVQFDALFTEWIAKRRLRDDLEKLAIGRIYGNGRSHALFV